MKSIIIDDKQVIAVLSELAFRLGVDEETMETIVKTALRDLANQYVKRPTLAMHYAKMYLKKLGAI